jgi:hypothetical protein
MRIASILARYLLGLVFLVFGLNKFFFFIKAPMPTGMAGQFAGALFATHYLWVIAAIEVFCAILLLVGRYVPLALTLLGPVIVNIDLYHSLMAPSGLPIAALVTILWFLLSYRYRSAFSGIFQQHVPG